MATHAQPGRRGWWISPHGDTHNVFDHFKYLLKNPKLFNLTEQDIESATWDPKGEERAKYITIACQRNWIRVREHEVYTTFEFWEKSESVTQRIQAHAKKFNYFPEDQLALSELSNKKITYPKVKDVV